MPTHVAAILRVFGLLTVFPTFVTVEARGDGTQRTSGLTPPPGPIAAAGVTDVREWSADSWEGVAIGLIGVLVVVAAVRFRAEEAPGMDAALRGLAAQPFGPF